MTEIKNILILGKEGKEKSGLANTLLNKNNSFEEVFPERKQDESSASELYQIEETVVEGITYRIIYLIGSEDKVSESDEPQVREGLTKLAKELKSGINHFLFLDDPESKSKADIFLKLFTNVEDFEDLIGDYFTFVNSNFADFRDQDERDRKIQELLDDSETSDLLR